MSEKSYTPRLIPLLAAPPKRRRGGGTRSTEYKAAQSIHQRLRRWARIYWPELLA